MKSLLVLVVSLVAAFVVNAAEERVLLARFEVKTDPFAGDLKERQAVIFYRNGADVEIERIGFGRRTHAPVSIGAFESKQLLERLKKIVLPKLDYQKHFDALAAAAKEKTMILHGSEVEVEMRINDARIRFSMLAPGLILRGSDDKGAVAVITVVEALVLSLGAGALFF